MDISVAAAPHLRTAGLLLAIASVIVIAFATLLPQPPGVVESHFCVICGSFGSVDAILNVVVFVPLGIGLALYGLRGRNSVVAICVLSAAGRSPRAASSNRSMRSKPSATASRR